MFLGAEGKGATQTAGGAFTPSRGRPGSKKESGPLKKARYNSDGRFDSCKGGDEGFELWE